jgi:three-Cys-motif partner protein
MERYPAASLGTADVTVRDPVKQKATDGLLARAGRIWTREKLTYLQRYASAFMTAMGPKRSAGIWDRLVYVDLLAGLGRDIDKYTKEEFPGSPLIALAVKPQFDHLFLADNDPENIEALKLRIPRKDRARVTVMSGDCNEVVERVILRISGRALGLAFIDPEGFEVKFDTLAKLAKRRIDLLYLFPTIGLRRNLRNFMAQPESPMMDDFWGGRDWRELPAAKQAAGNVAGTTPEKIVGSLVPAFKRKLLGAGFKFQDEAVPLFTNTKNGQLYHLLYFSHDSTGLKIWQGIKRIAPGGQRTLPGMD